LGNRAVCKKQAANQQITKIRANLWLAFRSAKNEAVGETFGYTVVLKPY